MEIKKLPKFEWERVDGADLGHWENEWGNHNDVPKNRIIVMYDLKWNLENND